MVVNNHHLDVDAQCINNHMKISNINKLPITRNSYNNLHPCIRNNVGFLFTSTHPSFIHVSNITSFLTLICLVWFRQNP